VTSGVKCIYGESRIGTSGNNALASGRFTEADVGTIASAGRFSAAFWVTFLPGSAGDLE
jgi:hypothetical protein